MPACSLASRYLAPLDALERPQRGTEYHLAGVGRTFESCLEISHFRRRSRARTPAASSVVARRIPSSTRCRLAARSCFLLALARSSCRAAAARADQAYDKVASAYAQSGGQLDPCAFTQAELEAAVRGIPPAIRNVVPALRRAMLEGIAAHMRGDCGGGASERRRRHHGRRRAVAAGTASTPATTTPPVTTPTQTAPAVPPAVDHATHDRRAAARDAPSRPARRSRPTQPAAARERDRTPLLVALVAAGALLLLALLLWGWARMRGWDPRWVARMRHGWGEAGFRTTRPGRSSPTGCGSAAEHRRARTGRTGRLVCFTPRPDEAPRHRRRRLHRLDRRPAAARRRPRGRRARQPHARPPRGGARAARASPRSTCSTPCRAARDASPRASTARCTSPPSRSSGSRSRSPSCTTATTSSARSTCSTRCAPRTSSGSSSPPPAPSTASPRSCRSRRRRRRARSTPTARRSSRSTG